MKKFADDTLRCFDTILELLYCCHTLCCVTYRHTVNSRHCMLLLCQACAYRVHCELVVVADAKKQSDCSRVIKTRLCNLMLAVMAYYGDYSDVPHLQYRDILPYQ